MIRVLLFLLAILVAVLGFVLQRPWLYAAAAVPLAGALALVARRMWSSYSSHRKRPRRSRSGSSRSGSESRGSADSRTSTGPRDESLEDFGIVDVRPQAEGEEQSTSKGEGAAPDAERAAEDAPATEPKPSNTPSKATAAKATEASEPSSGDTETTESPDTESEASPSMTDENGMPASPSEGSGHPLLTPYVEALRVALNAHTVCFLVQAEMALDYEIRAIASESEHVRHQGTFETTKPLLTPQMMEEPITIRPLDSPEVVSSYLGYYREPAPIDHVALAPVSVSGEPDVYFLLADATEDVDLSTKRAGTILKRFADTLSLVLESRAARAQPRGSSAEGEDAGESDETAPRPRTEIIAEEMKAADADEAPLSLLLVHLNRAEAIAREGEEAVDETEALFAQRLDDLVAPSRVVRFGELTYGIFFRGDAEAVEPFAADLQEAMDQETGALEGGVSIGVAVRADRHDPESLRADATEALSESYKTGACTIVE